MNQVILLAALIGTVLSEAPVNEYLPPSQLSSSPTSSRFSSGISQSSIPSNHYGPPSTQYGAPSGQFNGRSGQISSSSSQYNSPSSEYGLPSRQYVTPSNQYAGRAGQYPTSYSSGQYNAQSGQFGVSSGGRSRADGAYTGSLGQYSGNQYSRANQVPVLRLDNNPNAGDGTYSYAYETADGIAAKEQGTGAVVAQGEYSYTSPEGKQISVRYTADENGFHPEGDHIPTPSAAILKSIEINKAAEGRQGYQYSGEGQYSGSPSQQYGAPGQQYGAPAQFGSQDGFRSTQQYSAPNQQYGAPNQQFNSYSRGNLQTPKGLISRQYLTPQPSATLGQSGGYKY